MPYHLRSRDAVDCMLGYDADVMTVEYSRGFQCWVGYLVAGYRDCGIILAIAPVDISS